MRRSNSAGRDRMPYKDMPLRGSQRRESGGSTPGSADTTQPTNDQPGRTVAAFLRVLRRCQQSTLACRSEAPAGARGPCFRSVSLGAQRRQEFASDARRRYAAFLTSPALRGQRNDQGTTELSPFCGAKTNVVHLLLRRRICALLRSHQHSWCGNRLEPGAPAFK